MRSAERREEGDFRGQETETILEALDRSTFTQAQIDLIRRIVERPDRSCDVIRSSGQR
jgi:hypothetical protein